MIVARIERVPTAVQKCLKPGTEIHRCWIAWHADITRYPVQYRAGCLSSGKALPPDGRSLCKRLPVPDVLRKLFGHSVRGDIQIRSDCERSRRWPARLPAPAKPAESGPRRSESFCVSQYRLPNKYGKASSGRWLTGHCSASGLVSSGSPLSEIMNSFRISSSPGGATSRVLRLPNASLKCRAWTLGEKQILWSVIRSCCLEGWMLSIRSIGTS